MLFVTGRKYQEALDRVAELEDKLSALGTKVVTMNRDLLEAHRVNDELTAKVAAFEAEKQKKAKKTTSKPAAKKPAATSTEKKPAAKTTAKTTTKKSK